MYILGISCFYHDAAAALIKDGQLVCAAQEERFTRKKNDSGYPKNAISFCLEFANISANDLDYVVFYEKPFQKFERILKTIINTYPRSCGLFTIAMKNWFNQKLWIKNIIKERLNISEDTIFFTDHHAAHAASSFLLSPFKEAAILTIDGVGEWATATMGTGKETQIQLIKQLNFPNSLGLLYSTFTAFLGFKVNEGEYKVMGMAPYGQPKYTDKIFDKIVTLNTDGSIKLNMKFFAFPYSVKKSFSREFVKLFGNPRPVDQHFFTADTGFPAYFGTKPGNFEKLKGINQHYADIAASIQKVTEEIILKQAHYLHKITGLDNLCVAGGVALNSVANARLINEGPFKEIFIPPSPGDSGGAIGAALYLYNCLLNHPRKFTLEHAYWGKDYSNEEVGEFLKNKSIPFTYFSNNSELINKTVEAIMQQKVIGWVQGRFEWGPRALGNRSIIADPRNAEMKDIVNLKIKFREPFRPFAPVILEEELHTYFKVSNENQYLFRFMLSVLPILEEKRRFIPAVDHKGTGRVQTILQEQNPLYYQLIKAFGEKTGIPILLNTSFNVKGEPIANSPQDAYNTFKNSGLDMLVIGNYVIQKEI
ncbi:MAG: carbamoyltransferase [Candidatus Omnitrophota bacterium]